MTSIPFDIIVPSKGRIDGSTFALLEKSKLPYTVVVERGDLVAYTSSLKNATVWVLPYSNKGIGYCRAYILKKATRPFVMIDDDIKSLYVHNTTDKSSSFQGVSINKFLMKGWRLFQTYQIGLLGFKHGSFAIPQRDTSITTIAHIVFVNPTMLLTKRVKYDPILRVFEDIDVLFQCVQKGVPFRRYNHLVYYTTPSGTAKTGGIDYHIDKKEHYLDMMTSRYPDWIVRDKGHRVSDGQPLYHINWKSVMKI